MRKILHVSDVHFGRPHRPQVSAAVLDLVAERQPHLTVVAGDLTQRAKPPEFRQARAWVDRIASPTVSVPGNHDVPMYRVWERLFAPYGAYRRHFADEMEPVWEDDELFVVGVNSAFNWTIKDGRVGRRRLRRLADRLAAAPADKTRIAVVHHELVPAPRFGSQKVLTNAERLVGLLAEAEVELVLSGHLHQAYCTRAEAYYPAAGERTVVAHSGTTTSSRGRGCERGRNTAQWIEVEPAVLRLTRLEWSAEAARFVDTEVHEFPRPPREAEGKGSV